MSEKHELLFMDLDRIISKKHSDDGELINMRIEDQYGALRQDCRKHLLSFFRFRQKFKSFVDQYEMRELHFASLLRQKDLENQAYIMMLDQQRKTQELESSKSNQLTRQVSTFSQTETELRSQLNIYVEKFKQVSATQHCPRVLARRMSRVEALRMHSDNHLSRSRIP